MRSLYRGVLPLGAALAIVACSDNEAPPEEDHVPVRYDLLVDGAPVTAPYSFPSGTTVRVQIKFFNAADEDLDDIKDSHFGGLTFNPGSLAAAVRVPADNYQFDVTGGSPGSGTLEVSFGHDEAADEVTFDPAAAQVTGP